MDRNDKIDFTPEGFQKVAEALIEYPESQRVQLLTGLVYGWLY